MVEKRGNHHIQLTLEPVAETIQVLGGKYIFVIRTNKLLQQTYFIN